MTYPYVPAWYDYGPRKGPALGLMLHMAEGGGTVGYLDKNGTPPARGVSVHAVCEYSGRVVRMLDWDHASGSLNPADRSTDKAFYGHRHLTDVLGDWWTDPNSAVISIEIEGFAAKGPNAAQVTGVIDWAKDMKRLYPTLRGALGHADQTDTKKCPGTQATMLTIFGGIGGHGLWEGGPMPQLPIVDTTPHKVDVPKPMTFYDLDGKVLSEGHSGVTDYFSPYVARETVNSGMHFYAIYAEGPAGVFRLILTRPKDARPIPPDVDCSAQDKKIADAIAVLEG